MNIRADELYKIIEEISEALTGSFLQKIVQIAPAGWAFTLKKGNERFHLLVAISPSNSRVHLVAKAPEKSFPASSFGTVMKKTIMRSWLSSIETIGHDRIVALTFETAHGARRVVAQLFGGAGNMFLLSEDETVIASAYPGRGSDSKPGSNWKPPAKPLETIPEPAEKSSSDNLTTRFSFNRELERRYQTSAAEEILEGARRAAASPLKAELKKNRKREKILAKECEKLLSYRGAKKIGDILAANFSRIEKGATEITLPDLFSNGEPITIALDQKLSPSENMKRYYKRFRKYEKGLPTLKKQIVKCAEEIKALTASVASIEAAKSLDDIPATALTEKKGSGGGKKPAKGKKEKITPGRRFISSEGHLILVGKNDRENDELSGRFSNGRDLWLHARDYPGSHVLVRLPKKIELPQKTLREAAMLAICYSRIAKAGKGEVTYAYAKDVRKPKGFEPGKVTVAGGKTISVRVDKKTLDAMKERAEKA